ncbi:MAG: hypothetical protein HKO65_17230 [Gemmatimonadetes bacterium]|nr:hypothetical protein [Gemmatimonadota bacterium]NNM06842.1 hypothetical protein [Gemmatimonadota bacterium]
MPGLGSGPVLSSLREPLRAVGSVVLPSPDALDEEGWAEAERIIERALAPKPAGVRLQLRLFLRVLNALPLVTTGRTFAALPLDRRAAFLQRLHSSPVLPLRRGLWGVRTLLFMGYYNQPRIREAIGYSASPWGWTAHFGKELEGEKHPENGPESREEADA